MAGGIFYRSWRCGEDEPKRAIRIGVDMNLRDIINPLLKWWWLLVAATVVAAVSSYFATRPLPPIYQATSTLIVGSAFYDTNPTGTEYGLSIKLAEAYALLAQRGPVKDATEQALGLT